MGDVQRPAKLDQEINQAGGVVPIDFQDAAQVAHALVDMVGVLNEAIG